MKVLVVSIMLATSFSTYASVEKETIFLNKTNGRVKDVVAKIAMNGMIPVVKIQAAVKEGSNARRACSVGSLSNNRCSQLKNTLDLASLTFDSESQEILYNSTVCANIVEGWYGREIRMTDNCRLNTVVKNRSYSVAIWTK